MAVITNGRNNQQRINKYIIIVALWWLVFAIAYMLVSFKIKKLENKIQHSGIAVSKEYAAKLSMPLLERDMKSISKIIKEMSTKQDVINTSIVDHKNKIIAYSDQQQLLPVERKDTSFVETVRFWKDVTNDDITVFIFKSEVTFSDTKIGDLFLTVSAENVLKWKNGFMIISCSSFFILIIVLVILHYRGIWPLMSAIKRLLRPKMSIPKGSYGTHNLSCPLCGADSSFSEEVFSRPNLERFSLIHPNHKKAEPKSMVITKEIHLNEISGRDDLGWLKQQIILRCAEIIRKLAVE